MYTQANGSKSPQSAADSCFVVPVFDQLGCEGLDGVRTLFIGGGEAIRGGGMDEKLVTGGDATNGGGMDAIFVADGSETL